MKLLNTKYVYSKRDGKQVQLNPWIVDDDEASHSIVCKLCYQYFTNEENLKNHMIAKHERNENLVDDDIQKSADDAKK